MDSEAISASTLIRGDTRELHNKNAAIFAGAGLSMASGYVNWSGLLMELIQDLGLDPDLRATFRRLIDCLQEV
jgi:hypothetical protein